MHGKGFCLALDCFPRRCRVFAISRVASKFRNPSHFSAASTTFLARRRSFLIQPANHTHPDLLDKATIAATVPSSPSLNQSSFDPFYLDFDLPRNRN